MAESASHADVHERINLETLEKRPTAKERLSTAKALRDCLKQATL